MPYEGFFRNIRNATVWTKRRRGKDGVRHFEKTPLVYPSAGKATRKLQPTHPLWILVPPALVALLGVATFGGTPDGMAGLGDLLLFGGLSILCLVSAWFARASRPIRVAGVALSLIYPVWMIIAFLT